MPELPKAEVYFYFFLWISGVSASLYHLFLVGRVFDHKDHDQYHYEDFKNGWKFLGGRFQDQSDSEWNTWTALVIKLTPFLILNLVGAEIIRCWKIFHYLPFWYITVTICFLIFHFNLLLILWFLIQNLTFCLFIYIKSYISLWIASYIAIHFVRLEFWLVRSEEDQYIIMVSSSWMLLRCISFSVDKLNEIASEKDKEKIKAVDVLVFLAYSFYLPTMFCGPFISFHYFNKGIQTESKWSINRIFVIFLKFFRCAFWYFFTLFALHFIYVNAILLRPSFVKQLCDWELAGLGIAMGHFFHLKYIVFYGIPCAWAAAEGFTTPKLPCCVSRVHLYSYMWRRFDHGLYQFLIRYIYVPILSKIKGKDIVRKTLASTLCFLFVYAWHGQHDYVFFWVFFNFIAITIELAAKQICTLPVPSSFLEQNFSPQNQIRLQCFFAAPLHCFSMVSNYFFIGNGVDIGFVYLSRLIYGSVTSKFLVLLFLYGAGQSAVAVQKWERTQKKILKGRDLSYSPRLRQHFALISSSFLVEALVVTIIQIVWRKGQVWALRNQKNGFSFSRPSGKKPRKRFCSKKAYYDVYHHHEAMV